MTASASTARGGAGSGTHLIAMTNLERPSEKKRVVLRNLDELDRLAAELTPIDRDLAPRKVALLIWQMLTKGKEYAWTRSVSSNGSSGNWS